MIRKYDVTHVNIASFVNRFQQTKHGIEIIMKAPSRARCTHYRASHDKLSIYPSIRHDIEATHGKEQHHEAMFKAGYQHATGTYNSKIRHGKTDND